MANRKKQHYVPKMYLKKFTDDNLMIDIYRRNDGRLLTKSNYESQCQKNYLYSRDIYYEELLGQLESDVKSIIDEIVKTNKFPTIESGKYEIFIYYILLQSQRTLFAADNLNIQTEKLIKATLKNENIMKNTNISIQDIQKLSVKYPEPALLNLKDATLNLPLITDLRYKILINMTKQKYITSDNPVILYNLSYIDDFRSHVGLTSKGLILFFPINPEIMIMLFDAGAYTIIKDNADSFIIKKKKDIIMLNRLQILNSYKNFYTGHNSIKYVEKLYSEIKNHLQDDRSPVKNIILKTNYDDIEKNVLQYSKYQIKYKINLTFLKEINIDVHRSLTRNPLLKSIHADFVEKIENGELELEDWGDFFENRFPIDIENI